jgi:hypothetical protein
LLGGEGDPYLQSQVFRVIYDVGDGVWEFDEDQGGSGEILFWVWV